MEDEIKKEMLKEVVDYLPILIETAEAVVIEFKGEQEEDTKELFNQIIDGINWTLGMYYELDDNREAESSLNKKLELDSQIDKFTRAIEEKNLETIATAMEEGIVPFLKEFLSFGKDKIEEE